MRNMEFLRQNLLNTTSMLSVSSGTGTYAYLFDRNLRLGYYTVGYTSDTSTNITVTFNNTTSVCGLMLQNHNLKGWRVFYDGATANSLSVVTQNSATSTYLTWATVQAAQITVQMDGVITADQERSIGEMVVFDRLLTFERNPSHDAFSPTIRRQQIVHEMPDGGVKLFQIKDKFNASLRWNFVTDTFREQLYGLWSSAAAMYFVPYPTTTAWDGRAYEVAWVGDFDFTYDENSKTQGQGGSVDLRETTGG